MKIRAFVEVNIAVILFGAAGLFGKILAMPLVEIVFFRALFASISLGLIIFFLKETYFTSIKTSLPALMASGVILAFHWCSFFYSIRISSVSVGVLTYSSFPVFATLLEPLFFKERLKILDIAAAFAVVFGIYIIIPEISFSNNTTLGAVWGIVSGLSFAILSLLNRKFVKSHSFLIVACVQNFSASLVLFPFIGYGLWTLRLDDIFPLLFLGVVCTATAHSLFIRSLLHIKAGMAGVIACMEPVYAIIMAYFVLGEEPELKIIIGGSVIIGAMATGLISMKSDP